jgi:uncharacterized damage-inducible protein DinB
MKKPAGKKKTPKSKSRRTAIMRHSREGMKRPRGKKAGKRGAASDAKRFYLDRLRSESPRTLRLMRALPKGAEDFRAHARAKTAMGLVHNLCVANWAGALATRGELPMPPQFPPPPPTVEEAISAYERGLEELEAAVEAMPDSRLSQTMAFITGPGTMGRMSVLDVLWFMLLDSIHHRGQLSVYVRMAEGKVPSIYGPTADEPWR